MVDILRNSSLCKICGIIRYVLRFFFFWFFIYFFQLFSLFYKKNVHSFFGGFFSEWEEDGNMDLWVAPFILLHCISVSDRILAPHNALSLFNGTGMCIPQPLSRHYRSAKKIKKYMIDVFKSFLLHNFAIWTILRVVHKRVLFFFVFSNFLLIKSI
jgi:hypothetical protein